MIDETTPNHWNDMDMLAAFLYENSWIDDKILCGDRGPRRNISVKDLKINCADTKFAAIENFMNVPNGKNAHCDNYIELLKFKPGSHELPVPTNSQTGESFLFIHFQGTCKRVVHAVYAEHYVNISEALYGPLWGCFIILEKQIQAVRHDEQRLLHYVRSKVPNKHWCVGHAY